MTYEGIKQDYKVESYPRHLTDDEILKFVKREMQSKGVSWLENIVSDHGLKTMTADIVDALFELGLPEDKIEVISDKRAQLELDGKIYSLSSTAAFHTYLYEGENIDGAIDLFHIPAILSASYLVGHYFSQDTLNQVLQQILVQYKAYQVWADKKDEQESTVHHIEGNIRSAIKKNQEYNHLQDSFLNSVIGLYHHVNYDESEDSLKKRAVTYCSKFIDDCIAEYETVQKEKATTMVVRFKAIPDNFDSISYEESIEHCLYNGRAEIEDYFFNNMFSVDPPIKIFVKPDEKRKAYLLKTYEEPIQLSDGRIVIAGEYLPPLEELWTETRLFVFDSQEEFDKINDLEDYVGEEPLEISDIPLDILKELVSLNKAEVISFKELEELYNSPDEFMDVFNMYEEFYPIAIA